jgi:hypothetical protein
MVAEAQDREWNYNQQLIRIMREHELIQPEEEEQLTAYLFMTH